MTAHLAPLKRFAAVSYGLGQPPPLVEEGIPILRATNVERGRINPEGLVFANLVDLPIDRAPLLDAGEILVVRSGAYTGDSALVTDHWAGSAPGYDLRLTPFRTIEPRYLAYSLLSAHAIRQMKLVSQRAAQPHLNAEELGEVPLYVPPLAEQRAIADYLDAETARIDALIAKKQQLIHLLEERIASLVDAYFSPRHGEPTVRLARLATVQTGVTLNASKDNGGSTARMPYLRVANVQPGWLDLSEVKEVDVEPSAAARSMLRVGDVLMTEGGDIDKLGRGTVWRGEIENCLHQNHVFAVRPRPGQLDSDFLANMTRTSHARAYFESTGVQSTNLASTNSFKVADFRIPSLDLKTQQARSAAFEQLVQPLSESAAKLRRQIGLLAEHRQALITAAVTGELRVASMAVGVGKSQVSALSPTTAGVR